MVDRPVITTNDVEEEFGISQQAAYGRLSKLADEGVLDREKVGSRAVVWWLREGYDSE
jgi:DNA-binding Lrp family transcriptional regulator